MTVDADRIEAAVLELLKAIGEDTDREGLIETPARVARWWAELIDYEPGNTGTTFNSVHVDQMVAVQGVRVWSLCEHHLLPFYCDLTIGYITDDKVVGLSKLARIAHKHAHRLQIQERLVDGIATEVAEIAGTENVAVFAQGEHLCMTMRGIKTPGIMKSSATFGLFRSDARARAEFMALTK